MNERSITDGPSVPPSQLNRSAVLLLARRSRGGVSLLPATVVGTPGKPTVWGTPSGGPLLSWPPEPTSGPAEGQAHSGSHRWFQGTRARAYLLPGAGLPCPELDVAGDQLIPTCRDTAASQWEGPRDPALTSAHLPGTWGDDSAGPFPPATLLGSQGSPGSRKEPRPRWGMVT